MKTKKIQSHGYNCQVIKDTIDILAFCQDYYNSIFIPSTNGWYFTCCLMPDHPENNPSFAVNPEYASFHCFGCGEKGSIIDLVMATENFTLSQAVNFLLDYLNIQPDINSEKFYKIKKMLKPSDKTLDRDPLLNAKITDMKKHPLGSVEQYAKICDIFDSYYNDNDHMYIKKIHDN